MANTVRVSIEGDDNLYPVLDGLTDRIRSGVFQANLLGKAWETAANLGQRAWGGFTSALGEARAAQTDIIKSVGSMASAIGLSYEEADKLNQSITTTLAKDAGALPGSTDEYVKLYRVVSDNVATMNKELNNGVFNAEQYSDQVTGIVSKFRVMGEGTTFLQQQNALGDLLSGGRSIGGLDALEYFRNNPVLTKNLTNLSNQLGKDLNEMTGAERLQVVIKALDMSLTDDTVSRLSNTIDAKVASFTTVLTDPNAGLFGLMRDVDTATEGQQTAIEAITKAVGAVIDPDGLLFAIANTFKLLGLDLGDPMAQLRNASLWFTGQVKSFTDIFKGGNFLAGMNGDLAGYLQQKLSSWMSDGIGNLSRQLATGLEVVIPVFVNGLSQAIIWGGKAAVLAFQSIDWGTLATGIGRAMTQIDWGTVGGAFRVVIGALLLKGVVGIAGFLTMALLGPFGIAIAAGGLLLVLAFRAHWDDVVLGFSQTMAEFGQFWQSLTSDVLLGIRQTLTDAKQFWQSLKNTTVMGFQQIFSEAGQYWSALGGALLGAIAQFFNPAVLGWLRLKIAVANGINAIEAAVNGFLAGMQIRWTALTGMASDAIAAFAANVVSGWNALESLFAGAWAGVMGAAAGVAAVVMGAFDSLKEAFVSAWNGVMSAVTGAINGITSAINRVTSMIPGVGGGAAPMAVPNAATGHFPSGLGGVLNAAIREGRSMPSGAGLVIANSSEAILNRGQQSAIAGALASRGGAPAFAPQITVNGAPGQDGEAIASEVMRRIETEFRRYEAQFLTS